MSKDIANAMSKWGFEPPKIGDEPHIGIEKIIDFLDHVDAVFQCLSAASTMRNADLGRQAVLHDAMNIHENRKPRFPSGKSPVTPVIEKPSESPEP